MNIRKLYILYMALRCHKSLFFNKKKSRNGIVAFSRAVRTANVSRQYQSQSAFVYNLIYRKLRIYPIKRFNCKKAPIKLLG